MNLKFLIVKGKAKACSIHVRFWDSKRFDQKTKTGYTVFPDDWSDSKERLKIKAASTQKDFINNKLNHLEQFIFDQYNLDSNSQKYISSTWLKDTVASFSGNVSVDESHRIYFLAWVEKFVEAAPQRLFKGRSLTENSIKKYVTAFNKLKAFEKYKNHRYRFEEIDLQFHRDFVFYCSTVEKLNENTIGTQINRIKTFCRQIELEGLPISSQYKHRDFASLENETKDVYLNESEINLIFNHDFSHSESFDNARDLFIIGLRTGLRVSDFLRITNGNIFGEIINITTTKTRQRLFIPIHPQVRAVLNKRNGKLPYNISDQKFNLKIKQICQQIGLTEKVAGAKIDSLSKRKLSGIYPKFELVTSHICRRSFATNLYLQNIDPAIIMKATGHKTEAHFLHYIKATDDEHVAKIADFWKTQTQV